MDTYSAYMSTEYPPDFEKLIKKAEYEITEQLRAIQDELQVISGLQDQNEKKVAEIAKYEELINELNTDAGNLYSQFKQNGEIAASLKRATTLLEHHEEHLQKELAKTKDFHEEIRNSNNEVIRKYSTKWDEYHGRYQSFPLTKKVNEMKDTVNKSNCTVESLETEIENLTIKISGTKLKKGDKEEQLKMITKHITDLAIFKTDTKKTEQDIIRQMSMLSKCMKKTERELEKMEMSSQKKNVVVISTYQTDEAPPIVNTTRLSSTDKLEQSNNYEAEKQFLQRLSLQENRHTSREGSTYGSLPSHTSIKCTLEKSSGQQVQPVSGSVPNEEKSPKKSNTPQSTSTQNLKNRPQLLQFIKSPRQSLDSNGEKYHNMHVQDDSNENNDNTKLRIPQFYLTPKVGSPSTKKHSSPYRRDNLTDGEVMKSKIPRIETPKFQRPIKEKTGCTTPHSKEFEVKIPTLMRSRGVEEANTGRCREQIRTENSNNSKPVPAEKSPPFPIEEANQDSSKSLSNSAYSAGNISNYQETGSDQAISYVDVPRDDLRLSGVAKCKEANFLKSPDKFFGLIPNSQAKKLLELKKSPADGFTFASRPMFDGNTDNHNVSETGFFRMEESDRSFFGGEKSLFTFGAEGALDTKPSEPSREQKSPGGIFGAFGDHQENKTDNWSPFRQGDDVANETRPESGSFSFSFSNDVSSPDMKSNGFSLF